MKKLLLLLLMVPVVTFSQVSSWRNTPPPTISSNSYIKNQQSNVSTWRIDPPRDNSQPKLTKLGSNILVTDPWFNSWGWNRWSMWGAPTFGWNFWTPMWYSNNWGYRQPARIYVYDNGKRDTIKGKKPIINFTLHKTTNNQIGASFAIGNKNYFIMDYVSTFEADKSTFFPHGTINRVDFPLISDLIKERTLYIGGGVRTKRTGFHTLIGFGRERVMWRGKDAIGEITFPKSQSNFLTAKVGLMHDIKNFTIKVDADPIRNYVQFGLGLNF